MILWGALFIKLFGFSFQHPQQNGNPGGRSRLGLRVFHRSLLAGFGISRRNASIGALTLGLSPLYFPLATSFMTDVPALFAMLLCIYMCQSAVAATSARTTILWLVSAAMLNVASGTARQIAWLQERWSSFLPPAGFCANAAVVLLAFPRIGSAQPLSWYLPSCTGSTASRTCGCRTFRKGAYRITYSARTLLEALIPPVPVPLVSRSSITRSMLVHSSHSHSQGALPAYPPCLGCCCSASTMPPAAAAWFPRSHRGFSASSAEYPSFGGRPPIDQLFASSFNIPTWLRVVVTLFTFASFLVMAEQLFLRKPRSAPAATVAPSALQSVLWILGPFSAAYVLALLPRAQLVPLLDRYALCLMPLAIALLLLLYQRSIGPAVPTISFIVLAIFTFYAIADTHDYYADQRAGDIAIRKLTAAGVPETSISQSREP